MKINSVNLTSFHGIKVNKKQIPVQLPRDEQQKIITSWQSEIQEGTENITYPTPKLSSILLSIEPSEENNDSAIFKDTMFNYNRYVRSLRNSFPILDRKIAEAQNVSSATRRNVDKLKTIDKTSIQSLDKANRLDVKSKKVGLESIAGYDYELSVLTNEFISKIEQEQQGEDIDIVGSILFFGPYGNGKTHITKAIAQATNSNLVKIRPANDSEKEAKIAMQKIEKAAKENKSKFNTTRKRTIIFIDEIDRMLGQDSPVTKQFETFIKDCSKKYHCTVVAATNNPLELGVNYKNQKIFPIKMSIDLPENENMKAMFKYYLTDYPTENIDYDELCKEMVQIEQETKGRFNNGQIKTICEDAWDICDGKPITQSDISSIIKEMFPEIDEELVKKFNKDYETLIAEK